MSSWAHVCGFLCSVQSAPSISLSHSTHRLGHYWIVRDGFGGHVIHQLHQTFIPASNSTTVRGERPDSKGQWIESRQSVTSNLKERKTDLVNHPLITPPPLLISFKQRAVFAHICANTAFRNVQKIHTNFIKGKEIF